MSVLLVVGTIVFATIVYVHQKLTFWKRQGLPNEVSSIWNRFNQPFHLADQKGQHKYGDVIGIYEGLRPVLQISDPDLVKKVLIEDFWNFCNHRQFYSKGQLAGKNIVVLEDQEWKRMRQVLSPVFSSAKLKSMESSYLDCIKTLDSNFSEATRHGPSMVEVKDYFGSFSTDIICSVCFGIKMNSLENPQNELVTTIKGIFGHSISLKSLIVLFFPSLMQLFDLYLLNYPCLVYLNNLTQLILKERSSEATLTRRDFIQLLKEAKSDSGQSLSPSEISDQVILFLVAGYDTSSSSLSAITYCLALNQDVQKKLQAEIDDFWCRSAKSDLDWMDSMNDLKYLDCVIKESLRFLPVVPRMERRAARDCLLTKNGHDPIYIPKDTLIVVPIYTMNHDSRYWKDPDKFDPDRFKKDSVNNHVYQPFASGPRSCIGQRFAIIEIKACLIHILHKYQFDVGEDTKVPLEFFHGHPVSTAKEIKLIVSRRTHHK